MSPFVFPGLFPFDVNLILAIATATIVITTIIISKRSLHIPKTASLIFILIFLTQISLLVSGSLQAPEIWKLQSFGYLIVFLTFIAGINVASSQLISWMKTYVIVALIWGAVGLYVWLGGTEGSPLQFGIITSVLPPSEKLSGPFNQGNIFAAGIGIAWLFSHWLFLHENRSGYALAIILFTALLFDSLSRGGWITCLLALPLLLYAIKPDKRVLLKRLVPIWIAGLSLGFIFLELRVPLIGAGDITLIINNASYSLSARLLIWVAAIFEFFSTPFTGVGWGQFQSNFWEVKPAAINWLQSNIGLQVPFNTIPYNAHNIFLQLLAEGGVIVFSAFCWGLYKLGTGCFRLLIKGNSHRVPFAIAVFSFIIQSQINVIFHRPIILFVAAFFAGIALAPWLRKNSWKFQSIHSVKIIAIASASAITIWASHLSSQWFQMEQAVLNLNLNNRQSVDNLVDFSTQTRMNAISLTWLGFTVATERQHISVLKWISPYLKSSINEVPSVLAYQTLFYSQYVSREYMKACQTGRMISSQRIFGEKNDQAYLDICSKKEISNFIFGY